MRSKACVSPVRPSNGNNALRTLRRMLNKAREWKVIRDVPDSKLFKEEGRALRLDDQAEAKLLPIAETASQGHHRVDARHGHEKRS
jgi:hypothetical protein